MALKQHIGSFQHENGGFIWYAFVDRGVNKTTVIIGTVVCLFHTNPERRTLINPSYPVGLSLC